MIENPAISNQIIRPLIRSKVSLSARGISGDSEKSQTHIGAELFSTMLDVIDEYMSP
jgi:hypothetical protein